MPRRTVGCSAAREGKPRRPRDAYRSSNRTYAHLNQSQYRPQSEASPSPIASSSPLPGSYKHEYYPYVIQATLTFWVEFVEKIYNTSTAIVRSSTTKKNTTSCKQILYEQPSFYLINSIHPLIQIFSRLRMCRCSDKDQKQHTHYQKGIDHRRHQCLEDFRHCN